MENSWKIWIDGGMHAREWISPASVVYIIDQVRHSIALSFEIKILLQLKHDKITCEILYLGDIRLH